jgi:hypothetical protein
MTTTRDFRVALEQLRANQITFTEFARTTRANWDRMACALLRRWRDVPAACAPEDLSQEMLTQVPALLAQYDPAHGKPLEGFVVWNATYTAKRWLHKQRGAARYSDKAKSRCPVVGFCGDVRRWVEPEASGRAQGRATTKLAASSAFIVLVETDAPDEQAERRQALERALAADERDERLALDALFRYRDRARAVQAIAKRVGGLKRARQVMNRAIAGAQRRAELG